MRNRSFKRLGDMPDNVDFEDESQDFDLIHEYRRQEFCSELQKMIDDEDMNFLNPSKNSTRKISQLQFTPIREMERSGDRTDLLADIPFDDIEQAASLVQANFTVEKARDEAAYAQNTIRVFQYAERAYFSFLLQMNKRFPDLEVIQPYAYPLEKTTFLMYLYWLKVTKNYSYSSIASTFCYGFLSYLHLSEKSPGFRSKYSDDIAGMLRALLRKYGHNVFKVEPLLNPELKILRQNCNLLTEEGLRLNAILACCRARGLRGSTLAAMKLKDLTWEKVTVNTRFSICLTMRIVKEKRILERFWDQNLPGYLDVAKCPNIALLLYLADCSKLFRAGSAANCIIQNDFTLRPNVDERFVFCKIGSEYSSVSNKDLSNAMKNLSKRVLGKNISTRSCRTGLVVSTLLVDIIRNHGRHDEQTLQTLVRFVGWKAIECLKPYDRWVTNHFTAINYFQEGAESSNALTVVMEMAKQRNFLCGDELVDDAQPTNDIRDEAEMKALLTGGHSILDIRRPDNAIWTPHVRRLNPPEALKQHLLAQTPELEQLRSKEADDLRTGVKAKNTGHTWSKFWTKRIRAEKSNVAHLCEQDEQYVRLQKSMASSTGKAKKKCRERMRNIEEAYGANKIIEEFYQNNPQTRQESKKAKKKNTEDVTHISMGNYLLQLETLKRKRDSEIQRAVESFKRAKDELDERFADILPPEEEPILVISPDDDSP